MSKEQVGNDLWQEFVVKPFQEAQALLKARGPRVLTPAQMKRKLKNRRRRKLAR